MLRDWWVLIGFQTWKCAGPLYPTFPPFLFIINKQPGGGKGGSFVIRVIPADFGHLKPFGVNLIFAKSHEPLAK